MWRSIRTGWTRSRLGVTEWAGGATRIAALTGAGISTDSGIPDFRGPQGVWTKNPGLASAFTFDNFIADKAVRERFWETYSDNTAWTAEPNAAHKALAGLDRPGLAFRVLTQNIDGLHQKGGLAGRKVLELHGSMHRTGCMECRAQSSSEDVRDRVVAGERDPACKECGGILKLGIVMFGEYLDDTVFAQAEKIASVSQVFLAIGTRLEVEPAASLCVTAVEAGAELVIINRDPTPYDHLAAEVIREPIGEAVPRICEMITAGTSG
jgi:NAD-dependent deacetylase